MHSELTENAWRGAEQHEAALGSMEVEQGAHAARLRVTLEGLHEGASQLRVAGVCPLTSRARLTPACEMSRLAPYVRAAPDGFRDLVAEMEGTRRIKTEFLLQFEDREKLKNK